MQKKNQRRNTCHVIMKYRKAESEKKRTEDTHKKQKAVDVQDREG